MKPCAEKDFLDALASFNQNVTHFFNVMLAIGRDEIIWQDVENYCPFDQGIDTLPQINEWAKNTLIKLGYQVPDVNSKYSFETSLAEKDAVIHSMRQFQYSGSKLSYCWDLVENESVLAIICEKYPFQQSFDEEAALIEEWVDEIVNFFNQ